MNLPVGTQLLGGRYKIVRFINSGGFGCTYEAEHTSFQKRVAIKEFFVKDFCNRDEKNFEISCATNSKKDLVEKLKKKFIGEASALFDMQHPGIVRVTDTFEEKGTAYYVMEYIEGISLQGLLQERGVLPEEEALGYIRQVCEALRYVHSQNRLHLDIKPGNIMLNNKGRAVLIDFGASKHYDEESGENTSTLMGVNTPGYAPYEQVTQTFTTFSPSTDIYAVGATLYKLLTGITPPDSGSLMAGDKTLSPLPNQVSASTAHAIKCAMQSQRANRPQSIDEFLRLLDTPITVAPTHEEIIMEESDKTEILAAEKPAPTPKSAPTPASKSTPKENKRSRNSRNKWVILGVLLFGVLGYLLTQKGGDEDYSTEKHISSISSNNLAEERRQQEEQERLAQEEQERQEATERERKRKEDEERKKQESFQPTGYHQNYASVDLGLSVKWATCNVGANRPGDYGNYYAWGETTTKTEYTESNSKTYRLHMKDIGGNLSYDAACANWGGEWRMPTADEAQELLGYCSWTWSSKDGYNGYQVTSKKNGKSIFLPAEGWY